MKTLITISLTVVLITSCQQDNFQKTSQTAKTGPIVVCPDDDSQSIFRKSAQSMATYQSCFSRDIETLINNKQLISKAHWLILQDEFTAAEDLLIDAIQFSDQPKAFQIKLAKLYIKLKKWHQAKSLIEEAEIAINDPMRLKVEMQLGQLSVGTNYGSLPQIYKNHLAGNGPLRAIVYEDTSTSFELSRVDQAATGVLAAESSIRVSDDGDDILVTWTDSSVDGPDDIPVWRLQSAQSQDGGQSWNRYSISPDAHILDMYHFDPMTAYDPINNHMYAGGMTLSFTTQNLESFYMYRWDLDNNTRHGPYSVSGDYFDKGWLAVDEQSQLWMTAGAGGLQKSMDFGETFTDLGAINGSFSPQPRFKDDCLYIIDIHVMSKCGPNGQQPLLAPEPSAMFYIDDEIPGDIRVAAFRLMAIHPSGDLFITYPDNTGFNNQDMALWMSRSEDDGVTWETPWIITPDLPGDRFMSWIEIDELGGIHISYMDTRNVTQVDSSVDVYLDMYYSYSDDNGQTWYETRVTPTSLYVPELIWGQPFMGDYNELAVGNPESVFLSFPWSMNGSSDTDMYVAKKQQNDLIFADNFETSTN